MANWRSGSVWRFVALVGLVSIGVTVIGNVLIGRLAYFGVAVLAMLAMVAKFDTERGTCLPVAVMLMIVGCVLVLLLALLALT